MIVFYLIQNSTTANFLAKNASDAIHGNNNKSAPLAFFSLTAANPDHVKHTQIVADATTGRVQYNWEDLINQGDSDFNDATITVQQAGSTAPQAHAPLARRRRDECHAQHHVAWREAVDAERRRRRLLCRRSERHGGRATSGRCRLCGGGAGGGELQGACTAAAGTARSRSRCRPESIWAST